MFRPVFSDSFVSQYSREFFAFHFQTQIRVCTMKFQFLVQFSVNHLSHQILNSFSHQCLLRVFHWSFSDSTSPQVSRTLLSILADLNNAVSYMISTRLVISKSSSPYGNPLVTVPCASITIGINVIFFNFYYYYYYYCPIISLTHWLSGRVFANGPGERGSISGRVIPKTQMVLGTSLFNTQHYKVRFKDKVWQSRKSTHRCSSY